MSFPMRISEPMHDENSLFNEDIAYPTNTAGLPIFLIPYNGSGIYRISGMAPSCQRAKILCNHVLEECLHLSNSRFPSYFASLVVGESKPHAKESVMVRETF